MNLTERDFADVRAKVLARIEKRRRQSAWLTAAGLSFAILALVAVLMPHTPTEPAVPRRVARASARVLSPPPQVPPPPGARTQVRATPPRGEIAVATLPVHHHHRHTPAIAQMASAEPLTIELQTSDPNIRVIWIARQENDTP
jgi:hypothetical protein